MNIKRTLSKRPALVMCTVVALLAVVAMLPSLFGEFVIDDNLAIRESECVTGPFDLQKIVGRNFWCDPPGARQVSTWRPWPVMTWWVLWHVGGGSPLPFHLVNIVIHTLCALLLVAIAPKLSNDGSLFAPAIAGSLFAVMPIHADAVASIVGVADVWSLFFGMVALLYTLEYMAPERRPIDLAVIVSALGLSLLSKESGLVFSVIVPLLAIFKSRESEEKKRVSVIVLLSAAVIAVYLLLRALAVGAFVTLGLTEFDNILVAYPWHVRIPMSLLLLWKYTRLAVVGYPLSANYSTNAVPVDTTGLGVFLGGAILFALIAYGVSRRKDVGTQLLILWFIGSFLFISNILSLLPTMFAERLFYGPSAAFCLLFASILVSLGVPKRERLLVVLGSLCIITLTALCAQHANAWRTADSITRVTVANTPNSARSHVWRTETIGMAHGDPTVMEEHARRAIAIVPRWGKPHALLASSLDEQGRPREALAEFQRAMDLSPHSEDVVDLFIQFLVHYGHHEQAREIYLRHARARGGVPDPGVTVPPGM